MTPNEVLLHEFIRWQRDTRGRQPSSVYDYASRLGRFVEYIEGTPLDRVGVEHMEQWVARPRRQRKGRTTEGGLPATRVKDIALLRSMFGYLKARGYIDSDPTVLLGGPTVRNSKPHPVDPQKWESLWANPSLTDQARVVLGLGFFVGLRRAEMVALTPDQVDVRGGRLVHFVRKGGGNDVTPYAEMVRVFEQHHPKLIGEAASFLRPFERMARDRRGQARLLPWGEQRQPGERALVKHGLDADSLDPAWVNTHLGRWLRLAGMPDAFTPHQLRHSCATHLVQAGVPLHLVRDLLNHSSFNITQRYVKVASTELGLWRRGQAEPTPLSDYPRY